MTSTEFLLSAIFFQLVLIWIYIRWIFLKIEYDMFDPNKPSNAYGEGLVDGIQNAIERGQRGISTHG